MKELNAKHNYSLLDSRMQEKEFKFPFAKKQGYSFWSEMIEDLHVKKEMSPTDIVNYVFNNGYQAKLSIESVRGTLNVMKIYIKRGKKVITKIKKKNGLKLERPCTRCGIREIPPENMRLCTHCMLNNYRRAATHEDHRGIGNITKHAGSY